MSDLNKYKLEGTVGVTEVDLFDFVDAVINCNQRCYNNSGIKKLDKYLVISNPRPLDKYGYHYTLLLDSKKIDFIDLIYEIIWHMKEVHKEEKKKILKKLKEELDIEDE